MSAIRRSCRLSGPQIPRPGGSGWRKVLLGRWLSCNLRRSLHGIFREIGGLNHADPRIKAWRRLPLPAPAYLRQWSQTAARR